MGTATTHQVQILTHNWPYSSDWLLPSAQGSTVEENSVLELRMVSQTGVQNSVADSNMQGRNTTAWFSETG